MKIRGLFITGTDTAVGKTYVAAGIAQELRTAGIDVGVMKPVETGCRRRNGRLVPSDALRLSKSAGVHEYDSLDLVNPYRFKRPLAPSVAAEFEGKSIDHRKILSSYEKLAGEHKFMLVEGAGGILVPLRDDYTYLDLAHDVGLPVLIVARPGLGTINHTLLTLAALRNKLVEIVGIVINHAQSGNNGAAERTSPSIIEKMSGLRILGIMRHGSKNFGKIIDQL